MRIYIDVDVARRIIDSPRSKEQMLLVLSQVEPADVREVVQGEWICKADWKDIPTVCSHCKHEFTEYVTGYEWEETGDLPNYCPNCGAIMRNAVQI